MWKGNRELDNIPDNMTRKKRVDNNDSTSCPSCGKLFHRGKVHTADEKVKDHMRETGHSCNDSNCPVCGKKFHSGNVTAIVKLKDHMRNTGHSYCNNSDCPICGKQFHSGGYHPADQKPYNHMRQKDECHRQRARRMNWKISSWSHDVPQKLWFQH